MANDFMAEIGMDERFWWHDMEFHPGDLVYEDITDLFKNEKY